MVLSRCSTFKLSVVIFQTLPRDSVTKRVDNIRNQENDVLAVNCDMTSLKTTRLIESAQMRYVCTVHSRNKQNKVMVIVLFAALKIRPSSMCQQIQ